MPAFDPDDFTSRIIALLPQAWFNDAAKVAGGNLWAVVAGLATTDAWTYGIIQTLKVNLRLLTTQDTGTLQQIAADFLGPGVLPPQSGESPNRYRTRILSQLFVPAATRAAVSAAIKRITGQASTIIEPWNPLDVGAWGDLAFGSSPGYGWDTPAAHWGALPGDMPWQALLQTPRPPQAVTVAAPLYAGWDAAAGWDASPEYFADAVQAQIIPDQVVYDAINAAKPEGTTCWVQLT